MGRWSHERAVQRKLQLHDYIPTPLPTLRERRAQRGWIMRTLDINHALILSEALRCKRRGRFGIEFDFPLEGQIGNRYILSCSDVADVVRLWVWRNFHNAIGFESYKVRPECTYEINFTI